MKKLILVAATLLIGLTSNAQMNLGDNKLDALDGMKVISNNRFPFYDGEIDAITVVNPVGDENTLYFYKDKCIMNILYFKEGTQDEVVAGMNSSLTRVSTKEWTTKSGTPMTFRLMDYGTEPCVIGQIDFGYLLKIGFLVRKQ